jgi:hypothetical protein
MSKRGSRIVYLVGVLWFHSLVAGGSLHAQGVSFVAHRDFAAGSSPRSVAVGDFNGDGIQDLAVANNGGNNVSVLINNTP